MVRAWTVAFCLIWALNWPLCQIVWLRATQRIRKFPMILLMTAHKASDLISRVFALLGTFWFLVKHSHPTPRCIFQKSHGVNHLNRCKNSLGFLFGFRCNVQGAAGNVIVLQPTKTAMTFCDIYPGRWIDVPACDFFSQKLASASWSPSCFSKVLGWDGISNRVKLLS